MKKDPLLLFFATWLATDYVDAGCSDPSGVGCPRAVCENRVVDAKYSCTACPTDIGNGSYHDNDDASISVTWAPSCPYGLGTTEVTVTVQDAYGQTDSCISRITVIDTEVLDETNIDCGADSGVVASCGGPIKLEPSYVKENGCRATVTASLLTHKNDLHCYACQGANMVDHTDTCKVAITDGNIIEIPSSGEANYIAYSVKAQDDSSDVTKMCTICVKECERRFLRGGQDHSQRSLPEFQCPGDWTPQNVPVCAADFETPTKLTKKLTDKAGDGSDEKKKEDNGKGGKGKTDDGPEKKALGEEVVILDATEKKLTDKAVDGSDGKKKEDNGKGGKGKTDDGPEKKLWGIEPDIIDPKEKTSTKLTDKAVDGSDGKKKEDNGKGGKGKNDDGSEKKAWGMEPVTIDAKEKTLTKLTDKVGDGSDGKKKEDNGKGGKGKTDDGSEKKASGEAVVIDATEKTLMKVTDKAGDGSNEKKKEDNGKGGKGKTDEGPEK